MAKTETKTKSKGKGKGKDKDNTLSAEDRKKLGKKSFALPGKRKYPIPDKSHARNALARVSQNGTSEEKKTVRSAVFKRFPGLRKTSKDSAAGGASAAGGTGKAGKAGEAGKKS